jgi:hypothetical protein
LLVDQNFEQVADFMLLGQGWRSGSFVLTW